MTHISSDPAILVKDGTPETVVRRRARLAGHMLGGLLFTLALAAGSAAPAMAETGGYIVFDVASGEIFARHNADQAWYPASITKLMTTYVVFQMIKQGKLTFNSPVVVSAMAASQPPSKMGFPVGTVLTIDNALKMIMVKSANDIAWALAESAGGSKPAFIRLMNDYARQIGMTATVWDNPNGLPDPNQMTTAHDMGLLARALLREFPEYDFYYRLPGIQLGNRVIRMHNQIMDHYPGADGMKTGYICASGYNVVASATRNGHRMVAVILGSRGARPRTELAAELFNRGFERVGGGNIFSFASQTETLDNYHPGPEANQPVGDIHAEICGGKRNTNEDDSIEDDASPAAPPADSRRAAAGTAPVKVARAELLSARFDIGPPVKVWLGGAESVGTRAAALVQTSAPTQTPDPAAAPQRPASPIAGPRARAPGAILPLKPQPAPSLQANVGDATPPPAEPPPEARPPAQDSPIIRAFTLFQPQPTAAPPEAQPAVGETVPAPSPDPAADATALKVPVPKVRPANHQRSAEATPTTSRSTHAHKPTRPSKTEKAKKAAPEN